MNARQRASQALINRWLQAYWSGSTSEKGRILDDISRVTGWHRDHVRRTLRLARRAGQFPVPHQGRPPRYDEGVVEPLRIIWVVAGYPCGKRLAHCMGDILTLLEQSGKLVVPPDLRSQLLAMSPATIDRKLATDRKRQATRRRPAAWNASTEPTTPPMVGRSPATEPGSQSHGRSPRRRHGG